LNKLDKAEHVFLCDHHLENASEFNVFPSHCVSGTEEAEIVDELKAFSDKAIVIHKHSTNGFLEADFQSWLSKSKIKRFVIVGCCTDLCIIQFAVTLKTHFNSINEKSDILVVSEAIETYHLDVTNHPGDFMHIVAMKMMTDNGIKLVSLGEQNDIHK